MPICPTCGTPAPDGARFCEKDGTRLTDEPLPVVPAAYAAAAVPPAAPVVSAACRCGAGHESITDGFCDVCGRKWVAPRTPLPRDHVEKMVSPFLGGVTDRGQKHGRNEDDFAVSLGKTGDAVLVVCDGVSSSEEADRASAIAAKTMLDRLGQLGEIGDAEALRDAVFAANGAVCALHRSAPGAASDPPETTLVAAVVRDRTATLAWVGDSRAYWIENANADNALLLTHDHSWMNEKIDSGEMTEAEARTNRLAHAITRCLGTSSDGEGAEPTITPFVFPPTGGFLLLCSDGLWNYAPAPAQIAGLVYAAPHEDVTTIARSLVAWANAQGGRDNITVALFAVPDAPPDTQKETLNYELPN